MIRSQKPELGIGLNYPLLRFKYARFHWLRKLILFNLGQPRITLLVSALVSGNRRIA